jgi:transcriptional regulator with XRE-family HTH domain
MQAKLNGHDRDFTAHGKRIRAIRLRKKHWRQEDLAEATGLQTGTISRIETSYHDPQLATIAKIAAALEVDIDDIVEWHVDL